MSDFRYGSAGQDRSGGDDETRRDEMEVLFVANAEEVAGVRASVLPCRGG